MGMRPSASQRGCLLLGRCPNTSLERAVLTSLSNSLQAVRPLRRRSWGQLGLRSERGLLSSLAVSAAAALAACRPTLRADWKASKAKKLGPTWFALGARATKHCGHTGCGCACRPTLRAEWGYGCPALHRGPHATSGGEEARFGAVGARSESGKPHHGPWGAP